MVEVDSTVILQDPIFKFCSIIFLLTLSALFSGLTLGLLGQDLVGLEIIMGGDNVENRILAQKIYPLRKNGNQLLCTLLIGNVLVNSCLSVLMAGMTGGALGVFISTCFIVVFGEILPQAACSRHALKIGAATVNIVKFFKIVTFPAAYPIACFLDWALGEELGTIHSKDELLKLMEIHVRQNAIDAEQGNVVHGALMYKDIQMSSIMTKIDDVFYLSTYDILDIETISRIYKGGFSRIPVIEPDGGVAGLLLTKDLIFVDPKDDTPVSKFMMVFGRTINYVWPNTTCAEALRIFRSGHSHMAVVRDVVNDGNKDPYYVNLGICTLEDIVEEILGEEIRDETDDHPAKRWSSMELSKDTSYQKRIRLLNAQLCEKLSHDEFKVVVAYLENYFPAFRKDFSKDVLEKMLEMCPVVEFTINGQVNRDPIESDALYKVGTPADVCTLVLRGNLAVYTGKERIRSTMGPWSVLATNALTDKGAYCPDYSAYVASKTLRCIQINKETYDLAVAAGSNSATMTPPKSYYTPDITKQNRVESYLQIHEPRIKVDIDALLATKQTMDIEMEEVQGSKGTKSASIRPTPGTGLTEL